MTTLIFGRSGQVATALQGVEPDAVFLGRDEADLTEPDSCAAAIATHRPALVINAAAYTAVDRAEEEEALATVVNGDAPASMAQACAALDVPFVHISTDYVFDGTGDQPWTPNDPVAPQNAYGRSKLAGENGVLAAGGTYAILRTAWVFSETGNNFVKTMLRLAETRDALNVVNDQIGGPTDADAIARACLDIGNQLAADPSKSGTYHFAGMPHVSWADFAHAIFQQAGKPVSVTGIPSSEYPTPAARPANSRLDCSATESTFGIAAPNWQDGLKRVLDELAKAQ